MEHPGFKAIVKEADGVLEAYMNDLMVHDKAMIAEFPDSPFFWFCRSSGTHLIPLGVGKPDPSDFERFNALWKSNSVHFLWTGEDLQRVSYEKAKVILDQNRPLKFQF